MRDDEKTKISDDIISYLDEIAERLWSNHAVVMVGAGFSRNTKLPPPKCFPDWNQLGNIFYKKIYGHLPNETKKPNFYLNVLKLADEVRVAFGRPVLDQILRSEIPDLECQPSELHRELLELPWTDVFTTNYDTLLERARINITSKRFDIVVNKEDLFYSKQPRIVKLHGSFQSQRPFIISEEDYRRYPKEFAPFVNTVQQALLENTLCLIGFSGDDPNFLQWIGWIRDNLGDKNAPKIYLIGILNISDAKKKLLEHYNIIPVDLSGLFDQGDHHAKALKYFFKYMNDRRKDNNPLEWPRTLKQLTFNKENDITQQIKLIIIEWKRHRETFPNWIIVPEERRRKLWRQTQGIVRENMFSQKIEAPVNFELLYEINWRLEKCLCPIFDFLVKHYESIIGEYNPYPDYIKIEPINNSYQRIDFTESLREEIQIQWIELNFSLMRYYREKGILDKWQEIDKRLKILAQKQILSPEFIARWRHEGCLQALFSLNSNVLQSRLKNWMPNESLPFWEVKHASLLIEIGNIKDAVEILERSLNTIRFQLNLSPVMNDYSLVSQESYIMWLLDRIRPFKQTQLYDMEQDDQENETVEPNYEKKYGFSGNSPIQRTIVDEKPKDNEKSKKDNEFRARMNSLSVYECFPHIELTLFENYLEHDPILIPEVYEEFGFDIGQVIEHHNYFSENKEMYRAYNFLRFCEESGLPGMNFNKEVMEGVLKRISIYSPFLAEVILIRTGNIELIKYVFNRESIFKMQKVKIDELIDEYIKILQNVKHSTGDGEQFYKQNLDRKITKVIPEILSRLCVKYSKDAKEELFRFILTVYDPGCKDDYNEMSNLVTRSINSWSLNYFNEKIPELLRVPILQANKDRDLPDPFDGLFDKKQITGFGKPQIDSTDIEKLIIKTKFGDNEERGRAVSRLVFLFEHGFLNQEQENSFGEALWSQIDHQTNFPVNTKFYNFAFLSLPHPSDIDPFKLIKIYIKNEQFPIQKQKNTEGISIIHGNIPLFYEIIGATKRLLSKSGIDWSEAEAEELLFRMLEWWDLDKDYLIKYKSKRGNDEFVQRFKNINLILTFVIIPRLSTQTDVTIKEQLLRLLEELNYYGIPSLSAASVSIIVFPEKAYEIYNELEKSVISLNEDNIRDAYRGIFQLLSLYKLDKIKELPMTIWNYIISPIRWRNSRGLLPAIDISYDIVEKIPELLPQDFLQEVLIGLDYLIDETGLDCKTFLIDFDERLECRMHAASLAYKLYNYCIERHLAIPEVILKWKEVCSSSEEFSEIQNQWVEVNH
jgi:hypothetical protein